MLNSDGVHSNVGLNEFQMVFNELLKEINTPEGVSREKLDKGADQILELSRKKGTQDNQTLILYCCKLRKLP